MTSICSVDVGSHSICYTTLDDNVLNTVSSLPNAVVFSENNYETPTTLASTKSPMDSFPSRCYHNTNILLGLLPTDLPSLSLRFPLIPPLSLPYQSNSNIAISLTFDSDQLRLSPSEVLALSLYDIKTRITQGSSPSSTIFPIPEHWNKDKVSAFLTSLHLASFPSPLLTDAATAYVTAYHHKQTHNLENFSTRVVFVDVGYSGTTLVAADVSKTSSQILKISSTSRVGGVFLTITS
ncbi:hypothetical protein GEMRC1_011690 [Eukaryota sp. GEM-RC1]